MAHAYTPGLKVLKHSKVRKDRRLPIKGEVCKKEGDMVQADDIVARTNLPGNVHMVKVANRLNISPADIHDVLTVEEGDKVNKGDRIAQTDGLFGFFKSDLMSPVSGEIESISDVTGQIVMREAPIPVEVDAYVSGVVSNIIEQEGVTVESNAAYVQGIFGIGGEARGSLCVISSERGNELSLEDINESHEGKIIVGGSFIGIDAYKKALELNVGGIVVGGFNYYDLEEVLGYTLGVAITGTEDLVTSLIVTEGYGNIEMSERTFDLLKENNGKFVSINGATQIRAGVIRPEIVIPLEDVEKNTDGDLRPEQLGIKEGSLVRVIRSPFFGKIGRVDSLPAELQQMESETMVRVAKVRVDDEVVVIPRSNLEMLETD
ncbi:MAG: hypothetical protein QF780_09405 [Candidatus Marinimicrobia bacterium]|nr:hypothetical protein [Candidatus Neomarinimicrobiota bacterium]|tara:strand:- start:1106 stop:2233 length:1128 start_codon:yes stop_codon:yes gene_type:complete